MSENENETKPTAETEAAPEAEQAEGAQASQPEAEAAAETPVEAKAEDPADADESAEAPATAESEAEAPAAEAKPDEAETKAEQTDEAAADAPAKSKKGKRKKRGRPRIPVGDVEVGYETRGKVVGLAKFGAFVDIGSTTDGLVHISELPGNKRVAKVEDVLNPGDEVEVWVKEVDASKNRISLSMKKQPNNPMSGLAAGQVLAGTVSSVAKYGAFIDIGAETEGLVHISEMSSGFVQQPEDIVKPGDSVEVRIKELDRGRERISLSMVGLANDTAKDSAQQRGGSRVVEEDYEMPDEPEERRPTVLEMALRGAGLLASEDDEDEDAEDEAGDDEVAGSDGLTDVYSRMLDEYKETKAAEEG